MNCESTDLLSFMIEHDSGNDSMGVHLTSNPIYIVCIIVSRLDPVEESVERHGVLVRAIR